jgi:hypothetical protein
MNIAATPAQKNVSFLEASLVRLKILGYGFDHNPGANDTGARLGRIWPRRPMEDHPKRDQQVDTEFHECFSRTGLGFQNRTMRK